MSRQLPLSPEAAAELLRQSIHAPQWAVSVWPWRESGRVTLIIQVDAAFSLDKARVPERFEGFDVKTEIREIPTAGFA